LVYPTYILIEDPVLERRKLERFDLRLLAKIEGLGLKKGVHNLLTRNISAGGAFLETTKHLPENSRVSIDFVVPTGVLVKVTGAVLRSEPTGIAVRFDNEYQLTPLQKNSH
jgi:hypothetical protein